jgi:archaeal flagellar protein FlaG
MSAETFVNALFLITAVVAAGILITAVFPIIWNMAGTFSTASHESDTRMRTDFKIVTTYASEGSQIGKIWMKNIGSSHVGIAEIEKSDVFFGPQGKFNRASLESGKISIPTNLKTIDAPTYGWCYLLSDDNDNGFWDTGETLEVDALSSELFTSGGYVYSQFVLPNGIWRSSEFTASG